MKAYVIFFVQSISDLAALQKYKELGRPSLEKYGASFRVVRGSFEVLEGEPLAGVTMVEFPSMDLARSWYYSPEYQAALKHRLPASVSQAVLCEGLP